MQNIFIYSNSTRSTHRKFKSYKFPKDSIHVFLNDIHAYRENQELFLAESHFWLFMAGDNLSLFKNLEYVYDSKAKFEKFVLTYPTEYFNIHVDTLSRDNTPGIKFVNTNILNQLKNRSLTCGARAYIILKNLYPNARIVLVNFSDETDPIFKNCGQYHDIQLEKTQIFNNSEKLFL